MSITKAYNEWKEIAGVTVLTGPEAILRFSDNTLGTTRKLSGVVQVTSVKQVQSVVHVANRNKIPLYPISGGHNWGYGSALPATDDCVILDLSGMNKIVQFNDSLGYVIVEPGVTQQQLYEYIKDNGFGYMVPTTGAGPQGSILGNALEKGYGITPQEDHFGAVLSLKAILPSGEIYESALAKFGGYRSDSLFKWKIGPYLEGLFTQGNMGIVVQATIALSRKPKEVTQFLAFVDDEHFEEAVSTISRIKQQCGSLLGGVNIMNRRRLLAMIEGQQEWLGIDPLPEMQIRKLAEKRNLSDWVVMGAIYSPVELISGTVKFLESEFRPVSKHILFLNRKKVRFLKRLTRVLPFQKLKSTIKSVERALSILEGTPNPIALTLAYLKNHHASPTRENLSPDKDRCGLIWFSPLLPIDPSFVRDYTQEVTRVCLSQGIEPLITLTAISERCFDSTIPILFNQDDKSDTAHAYECHQLLLELSKEMGIFPYRIDIDTMRKEYDKAEGACFTMLDQIKKAVDPNNIIAPGRYSRNLSSTELSKEKHQNSSNYGQ